MKCRFNPLQLLLSRPSSRSQRPLNDAALAQSTSLIHRNAPFVKMVSRPQVDQPVRQRRPHVDGFTSSSPSREGIHRSERAANGYKHAPHNQETRLSKDSCPSFWDTSPLQFWLTGLMRAIDATGRFEAEELPTFNTSSAQLRRYIDPLKQGNVVGYLTQKEIGGKLALGALLEACTRISASGRYSTEI